jgi:hypothetical protein
MRWFTDEIYESSEAEEAEDVAWNAMLAAYWAYVTAIASQLPKDLAALATEERLNLHDARFEEVRWDREAAKIDMRVVVGALRLDLHFGDAAFTTEDIQKIEFAVEAVFGESPWVTQTAIRAQEVEIAGDGRYLLRLRLWPFHEFGIEFGSFSLAEEPAPEHDRRPGRFMSLPCDAEEVD